MIAANTPLMEAGVDSLGATELQRGLSEQLSTEFEATLLFDHPSIDGIVSCYTASGATLEGAAGVSLTSTPGSALATLEEAQISLAPTMLSIDGWSKRSVASNSVLSCSLNPRCSSVAPRESTPASISGVFAEIIVPRIFATQLCAVATSASI